MLKTFLSMINDNRRAEGKRYELDNILLLSILAILSGATSYRKIYAFIDEHFELFKTTLGLKWKRKPAYTSIRNIIKNVDSASIEEAFRKYSTELVNLDDPIKHIAIDGKTLRGSFDKFEDQKAAQILSAFLQNDRIILGHIQISEKSNEIPAAQTIIKELGLEEHVFTLDAMHCQKKTFEAAEETNNDLIVQVKDNQPTLLNDIKDTVIKNNPNDIFVDHGNLKRNRQENRTVKIFTPVSFSNHEWEPHIKMIIQVTREVYNYSTSSASYSKSLEVSYYASTINHWDAKQFAITIKDHWGIENRDHYVRDVSLGEDASRIRRNPGIFAKLRSFSLNILRKNNIINISDALFRNALNINNVLNYQGIF